MRETMTYGRMVAAATGLALFCLQEAAQACPGCKQVDGAPLNGASLGFSLGVLFMLFMVGSTLGGLGWMMYRSCQALAARDLARAEGYAPAGETA